MVLDGENMGLDGRRYRNTGVLSILYGALRGWPARNTGVSMEFSIRCCLRGKMEKVGKSI